MSRLEIRPLNCGDQSLLVTALDLLNRTQGEGLFTPDYLTRRLENPAQLVVSALSEGQLVGVAVAELIEEFDYYVPFHANIACELASKTVGSFTTLSVVEAHQGRGIGQLLSQRRIDWLQEKNCEVALGVSWVSGLAHTSNRTFERAGFRAIKKLDDFYVASSLEKPFDCPGCRSLPCKCAAIFYRRDF